MHKEWTDFKNLKAPGRGQSNEEARLARVQFLEKLGKAVPVTAKSALGAKDVRSNIESFVGATQIPVGLVGPLLYQKEDGSQEAVFSLAATSEGALIASMNRGASVISSCGGFRAHVQDQRMLRAPLFCFEDLSQARVFAQWIQKQKEFLSQYIRRYSRHAELLEIRTNIFGRNVETKFYYRTGDAAGQNQTTICTWHSCLWIEKEFNEKHAFPIKSFLLEGNGASDKKISYGTSINGRGIHVIAEAIVDRDVLKAKLKVTPEEIIHFFNITQQVATSDGMVGYNINVANSIAAIFAATGQDLACVHESAVGFFQIEAHPRGLYFSLKLPKLVIGTVGGGTGLPTQREALEVMGCVGSGKVYRMAEMIAGFTLGLEISTMAAIASGQFALAHERLGRNRPLDSISLQELQDSYLAARLPELQPRFVDDFEDKNGIILQLADRQNSKHMGLSLWRIKVQNQNRLAILKSKPTHPEILNAMYRLTGLIDPALAKSFCLYQGTSEFVDSHVRETEIYQALSSARFTAIPELFGSVNDAEREGHMILMEYLDESHFRLMNSEATPEAWTQTDAERCIRSIVEAQKLLQPSMSSPWVRQFRFESYGDFFSKAIETMKQETGNAVWVSLFQAAHRYLEKFEATVLKDAPLSVVHNDFNPRNVAVSKADQVKIYDWELSAIDLPHRDFIEFACFTQHPGINFKALQQTFESALGNASAFHPDSYRYAFAKFLVTRVSLYVLGNSLSRYTFLKPLLRGILQINSEEKYFV
ncbi:MAG: phosphotransferase [Bdellovibrionales bacterium]|nr:phosphotransferase [Bdellovibrionales bacterium]